MTRIASVLAVLLFAGTARAQDVPLTVTGNGVKTIMVVESLPFTISAPLEKRTLYFWTYPATVTAEKRQSKLEIKSAPKGSSFVVALEMATFDTKLDDFVFRSGRVEVNVTGDAKPPPGPEPPKYRATNITFVGAELTAQATATNNSAALRVYLASKGLKTHVLTSDPKDAAKYGLTHVLDKLGGPPVAILQDDFGHVVASSFLSDETTLRNWIAPYLEK